MNRSPERNTFRLNAYIDRCHKEGREPREDYINLYKGDDRRDHEHENNDEWKKNNLEYDLRSTEWICNKAKTREEYAQNLYAALCNQDWQKNDVWPLLAGQTYSCSWRYAGGIVADMVEKGDYIDWYCSGIGGGKLEDEERAKMSSEDIARYEWAMQNFVAEGYVTEEIRQDLFKLGWIPVDSQDDEL